MTGPVSNREIQGNDRASHNQFAEGVKIVVSLPLEILTRIFGYTAEDQNGVNTINVIRSTCREWRIIIDQTVLPQLYREVVNTLKDHPFFQPRPEFQAITHAKSDELKSFILFNNLSRSIKVSSCLLSPEQYLEVYQRFEDASLVKVWERIKTSIGYHQSNPSSSHEIREWIKNPDNNNTIQGITKLNLSKMNLLLLPREIGAFVNLQELCLSDNRLQNLPESIGNLRSLERLFLSDNRLQSLPESIGNLQSLQWLSLSKNQLKSLPESIRNLQRLLMLFLDDNLCLFILNKEFSRFTIGPTQKIFEKYKECKEYKPRTSFAALCQHIHNQKDKDELEQAIRGLPPAMQDRMRGKIEKTLVSFPENCEVENKELLRANALKIVCWKHTGILNQVIIDILKETFAAFSIEQKRQVYDHVWDLAGKPEGDPNWGENHAEDNIIRLIDAVVIVSNQRLAAPIRLPSTIIKR